MPSANALKAGKAVIELGLSSDGVRDGLAKLQDMLRRFGNELKTVGSSMLTLGRTVTDFVGRSVKQFSEFGDNIAKMAARTGFAVETLSALDFAAAQSGASLEGLDKSLAAMARFTLDAADGGATAADALKRLGVSAEDLLSANPEQQFFLLAEAIARVTDPTLKAGLALEVFGRQGRQLLPMLQGGRNGIKALIQEAYDLGIVLSEEDAKAAEELNDAFGRVIYQVGAMSKEIAVAVTGPLLGLLEIIKENGKAVIDWIRSHQALVLSVTLVGAALAVLGVATIALGQIFISLSAIIGVVRVAMTALTAHPIVFALTAAALAVGYLSGAFEYLTKKIDEATGAGEAFDQGLKRIEKQLEKTKADSLVAFEGLASINSSELDRLTERLGASQAASAGQGRLNSNSLFDTRLAVQVFGQQGSRVEDEQLRVLKEIERNTATPPGIKVT